MSEIEWGTPPPYASKARKGSMAGFVQALKERPGEWAKYPHPHSQASGANDAKNRYPGTEWTTRRRPDGKYDSYGRWVGES